MTFRIDDAFLSPQPARWTFRVKGYRGEGIYCSLSTDQDGHGLIACLQPGQWEQILSPEDLDLSSLLTRVEAQTRLAEALTRLGWGPELDARGDIVERQSAVPGTTSTSRRTPP